VVRGPNHVGGWALVEEEVGSERSDGLPEEVEAGARDCERPPRDQKCGDKGNGPAGDGEEEVDYGIDVFGVVRGLGSSSFMSDKVVEGAAHLMREEWGKANAMGEGNEAWRKVGGQTGIERPGGVFVVDGHDNEEAALRGDAGGETHRGFHEPKEPCS
jgi:hypothetical protein